MYWVLVSEILYKKRGMVLKESWSCGFTVESSFISKWLLKVFLWLAAPHKQMMQTANGLGLRWLQSEQSAWYDHIKDIHA